MLYSAAPYAREETGSCCYLYVRCLLCCTSYSYDVQGTMYEYIVDYNRTDTSTPLRGCGIHLYPITIQTVCRNLRIRIMSVEKRLACHNSPEGRHCRTHAPSLKTYRTNRSRLRANVHDSTAGTHAVLATATGCTMGYPAPVSDTLVRKGNRCHRHTYRVLYLAMSPDGQTIVTGAGDETLRFWNVFPGPKNKDGSRLGTSLLFPSYPDIR